MFGIDKKDHQNRFQAAIAQLGERQTEDLKVPGSIPGRGTPLDKVCNLLYTSLFQFTLLL